VVIERANKVIIHNHGGPAGTVIDLTGRRPSPAGAPRGQGPKPPRADKMPRATKAKKPPARAAAVATASSAAATSTTGGRLGKRTSRRLPLAAQDVPMYIATKVGKGMQKETVAQIIDSIKKRRYVPR
jgi:hypothetical protein